MRVIMTGGGTGGHIYPAIAIAEEIKEKHSDAEILFVGTERGLESKLIPDNGYNIKFITVTGFNRKNIFKNIKVVKDLMKGDKQSKKILKEFKPNVVIGTGGYVCGPVVRAAKKMGIKCFIHEQNAFPGVTNKLLEKYVDKVFISFKEAEKYFKEKDKLVLSGNPVRQSFFDASKEECRKELGIRDDEFVLLCFGGSRGAEKINKTMTEALEELSGTRGMQVFFVTGKVHYQAIMSEIAKNGIELGGNIHIMEYIDKMDNYLPAADLIISRSGALTVSEITVCGVPSILIPSPYVTGNHQFFNAKAVADYGGAIILPEDELCKESLLKNIKNLMESKKQLEKMALNSRSVAPKKATEIIYQHLGI